MELPYYIKEGRSTFFYAGADGTVEAVDRTLEQWAESYEGGGFVQDDSCDPAQLDE